MTRIDIAGSRDVRAEFEALLVAPLLKPLEAAMGEAGEIGVEVFAREIAERLGPMQ
jgi:hypothetical protein